MLTVPSQLGWIVSVLPEFFLQGLQLTRILEGLISRVKTGLNSLLKK